MKLNDLYGVIAFTFDLADNEVDGTFYIELEEINPKYASQIEVVSIQKNLVVCKLTDFIRNNQTSIRNYIIRNYYPGEIRTHLLNTLVKSNDITNDDGDAVYHFLTNDMYDFLTN